MREKYSRFRNSDCDWCHQLFVLNWPNVHRSRFSSQSIFNTWCCRYFIKLNVDSVIVHSNQVCSNEFSSFLHYLGILITTLNCALHVERSLIIPLLKSAQNQWTFSSNKSRKWTTVATIEWIKYQAIIPDEQVQQSACIVRHHCKIWANWVQQFMRS